MPVRRATRQPRAFQRQDQPDLPEPDLGDQFPKPDSALGRRARAAEIIVDNGHRPGGPAELDRALAQRILPRPRLVVALELLDGRLAHIHHRAPAPMRVGDLRVPHPPPPRPAEPATGPTGSSPRADAARAASPTPPRPPP